MLQVFGQPYYSHVKQGFMFETNWQQNLLPGLYETLESWIPSAAPCVEAACEIAVINCLYNPIPLTRLPVQSPVQEHSNEITGVAVFNTLQVLGYYSAASN